MRRGSQQTRAEALGGREKWLSTGDCDGRVNGQKGKQVTVQVEWNMDPE